MSEEEKSEKSNFIYSTGGLVTVTVIIAILTGAIASVFSVQKELSNNVTLVAEIGVGVIIAVIVFVFTKKSEIQNNQTLERIEKLENEQSELIKQIKPKIEKQEELTKSNIENQEEKLNQFFKTLKREFIHLKLDLEAIEINITSKHIDEMMDWIQKYDSILNDSVEFTEKQLDNNRIMLTQEQINQIEKVSEIIKLILEIIQRKNKMDFMQLRRYTLGKAKETVNDGLNFLETEINKN